MATRAAGLVLLLLVGACGENGAQRVEEPIPDIPSNQQRSVTRSEFRYDWPFTVGAGTVGCAAGAVVFRTAGLSYALNDAARLRGLAPVDPIRQIQGSGPPTDPLKRMKQDDRMRIFAAAASCDDAADATECKRRMRSTHTLSDTELNQVEAEGKERRWPPLSPARINLDPLIDAGLKLCRG